MKYRYISGPVWFCGLLLTIALSDKTIKIQTNIEAVQSEITILQEQISDIQQQISELPSKMPQNQFSGSDEDLPTEEEISCPVEEYEVSRGVKGDLGTPVLMRVTAYDLSYESCKKYPDHPEYGIGASGKRVKEYHSIAAGPELPFGTRVYIPALKDTPNSGIYTVEDRGSAIKENCLDIFMGESAYDECMRFGVQYLDVYVLEDKEL